MTRTLVAALVAAIVSAYVPVAQATDPADSIRLEESDRMVQRNPGAAMNKAAKRIVESADFTHLFLEPEKPSGETIVLLHGSGGDEASLVSLAKKIAPNALLLGVRGRIMQEGVQRWYKRLTPVSFDQDDIKEQANAFADFLKKATDAYKIDLARTTFLGYSNGANLIGAMTLLHPGLVNKAILLRAMPVLDGAPEADLSRTRFLTVAGDEDALYAPFASKLEKLLRVNGAKVDARIIHSGHLLGDEDVRVVSEWLAEGPRVDAASIQ